MAQKTRKTRIARISFREALKQLQEWTKADAQKRFANGKRMGLGKTSFIKLYDGLTKKNDSVSQKLVDYYDPLVIRDDFYYSIWGQTHVGFTNQSQIKNYQGDYKYFRMSPVSGIEESHQGYIKILNKHEDAGSEEEVFVFYHMNLASNDIEASNVTDKGMVLRRDDVIHLIGVENSHISLALFKKIDISDEYITGIVLTHTKNNKEIFASRFMMVHESHPKYEGFGFQDANSVLVKDYENHDEDYPGILSLLR